ncbi:FeS assembly protein SufA [Candidatus Nanohaloarchaea archaeon]|nr:FeS assembly protein SufA [Candidatus Nanohaloarchaea archaeon]
MAVPGHHHTSTIRKKTWKNSWKALKKLERSSRGSQIMYREEILDHYKRPRNEGSLETEYEAEGDNSSCGDHTHVYLDVEYGEVKDMKHETDGCAICTSATSILSEEISGMSIEEVEQLDRDWMIDTLDIEVSPMRVKCAMLGLKTAQKALEK